MRDRHADLVLPTMRPVAAGCIVLFAFCLFYSVVDVFAPDPHQEVRGDGFVRVIASGSANDLS